MSFRIIAFLLLVSFANLEGIFNLYPLANDYFDIIYQIKHISDTNKLQSNQDNPLFLRVYCKQNNVVSVSLTPTLQFRQQPRFPVYSKQEKKIPKFQQEIYTFLSACNVQVKVHPRENSIVQIVRRDNNKSIFQLKDITLSQGYNKFTVVDDSIKWGFGERFQHKFKVTDGSWTIWNRDKPWEIDSGRNGRSGNTYGHQPVYLAKQRQSGYTHLTYFKNTHGMLVQTKQDTDKVIYNSLGGNIHFVIFVGDKNPEKILEKYHNFIGGIHIPPFWALGWHQCRWGYKNLNVFQNVVENYERNDLPLDTMWNDLDYMDRKAIFTIDQYHYPSQKLKQILINKKLHWIPLIDVGVSLLDTTSMSSGKQMDVFLRSTRNPKEYYVGEVWPGNVHFVDYLHPNSSSFWKTQLNRLYEKVPFSGIWLDMNEPSNFRGNQPVIQHFRIQQTQTVNMMTIDVNLRHYDIFDRKNSLAHWQVHSYYGHSSVVPTFDFLKQHGRPFIISRSNSVSTGKYAGHWTGDNSATWDFLRLSISGNFLFQIFGIQMVGADICGFNSDTTQQLCSRWTQLGSLYPFARNHNQDIAKDQQPYALGQIVLDTAKVSIKQRYSLLKQLYSILVDLNGKGSFFRPLYFQFYQDQVTTKDDVIQTEFLLGKFLLSAPIIQQSHQQRNVYFPGKQSWYSLEYNIQKSGIYRKQNVLKGVNKNSKSFYKGGSQQIITNRLATSPPLFLRSGNMIFTNKAQQRSRSLNNKFYVTAALNNEGVSLNRFLTIQNYENESILGKCIQKRQCMTQFTLKKSAGAQVDFDLSWIFKGDPASFGPIQLIEVTIWQQDNQWVSKEKNLQIKSINGSIKLTVEKTA